VAGEDPEAVGSDARARRGVVAITVAMSVGLSSVSPVGLSSVSPVGPRARRVRPAPCCRHDGSRGRSGRRHVMVTLSVPCRSDRRPTGEVRRRVARGVARRCRSRGDVTERHQACNDAHAGEDRAIQRNRSAGPGATRARSDRPQRQPDSASRTAPAGQRQPDRASRTEPAGQSRPTVQPFPPCSRSRRAAVPAVQPFPPCSRSRRAAVPAVQPFPPCSRTGPNRAIQRNRRPYGSTEPEGRDEPRSLSDPVRILESWTPRRSTSG
jgi:hypothetical protein